MATDSQRRADCNDLMDPDWKPDLTPPSLSQQVEHLQERVTRAEALLDTFRTMHSNLQKEIEQKWQPWLKKAKHEAAVFQQELMDKHEQFVEAVSFHQQKAADAEKGRVVAFQAMHNAEDREIKLVEQNAKLRADNQMLNAECARLMLEAKK
jgi:hypothetical protein